MQYENIKNNEIDFTFESKNFSSIFGLYLFSLGAVFSGYSFYLLLETTERIERNIITWSGQGLFWSMILFFIALFILFIPVEFLNVFKIYNATFKDLIFNIIYSIGISLIFLVLFQFFIKSETLIMSDISSIGKSVSFAGFIAIPLILFIQHTLRGSLIFIDRISYSLTLFIWIISSQIFL
tara:strand:+ start:1369 stop:1911 length:543 start_codon:yes stop_codon:yes gene_type:complete